MQRNKRLNPPYSRGLTYKLMFKVVQLMQIGFNAFAQRYKINNAQPLRVKSAIGSTRTSRETDDRIDNQYPASYQPEDSFIGHFEFGLKHVNAHNFGPIQTFADGTRSNFIFDEYEDALFV